MFIELHSFCVAIRPTMNILSCCENLVCPTYLDTFQSTVAGNCRVSCLSCRLFFLLWIWHVWFSAWTWALSSEWIYIFPNLYDDTNLNQHSTLAPVLYRRGARSVLVYGIMSSWWLIIDHHPCLAVLGKMHNNCLKCTAVVLQLPSTVLPCW